MENDTGIVMKTLVVYDSVYGNTEKIARAIGEAINGEVEVVHANAVNPSGLDAYNLLVVGGPTHAGRATQAIKDFLKSVPASAISGTNVAAFDTRLTTRLVKIFGFAAGRIASSLEKLGGRLVVPPEPFYVVGGEGPLREGEVERAAGWAREIEKNIQ